MYEKYRFTQKIAVSLFTEINYIADIENEALWRKLATQFCFITRFTVLRIELINQIPLLHLILLL